MNTAGDTAAADAEKFPARKRMINFPSFDTAVHMFLAEWTLVPVQLFAGLRFHIRLWWAWFLVAGCACGGSRMAHGTCGAIWQSVFAALHVLGERNRAFLLGLCQNFTADFVYYGLLTSTCLAPSQRCQPLVCATGNSTHQG